MGSKSKDNLHISLVYMYDSEQGFTHWDFICNKRTMSKCMRTLRKEIPNLNQIDAHNNCNERRKNLYSLRYMDLCALRIERAFSYLDECLLMWLGCLKQAWTASSLTLKGSPTRVEKMLDMSQGKWFLERINRYSVYLVVSRHMKC